MDFLLNPNVAYILLVIGVVLGFLAVITPGTGIIEIGTLFALVLAGYGAYHLGINAWALGILLLSILPFVFAIRAKQHRGWWLGGMIVLMVVGSVFLFTAENSLTAVDPFVAITASILAGGFLWFSVDRSLTAMQAPPTINKLGTIVGQTGEARTEIHDEGSVQVGGELWSARSKETIKAGSTVRVTGREGFILIVEKSEEAI